MQKVRTWFGNNKNKLASVLFYFALSLELITMMLLHSPFSVPFQGRIPHIAFLFFGTKILLTKYTKKEWAVIVLLGIVGTISYITTRDEWVIRIVLMVIASKNISLQTVAKYTFWVSLMGTGIIIMLACVGMGRPLVDVRDYGRGLIEERWCLGFSHANNVHGMLWYIASLGIFAYFEKTRCYHYILLTVANVGIYLLTLSRGGLLVTQMVLIAVFIYRYYPKIAEWKWIYLVGNLVTIFCAGIGIYTVARGIHGRPILKKMSDILTGRLELLTWWEKVENWTLFGSPGERVPVDVGYITVLSRYGYVIFALYVVCIFLLTNYYLKNHRWIEYVILMTCVFYTFMESTFTINTPLLCNFTFVLLLGTWNHLLMRGQENESVQSKVQVN